MRYLNTLTNLKQNYQQNIDLNPQFRKFHVKKKKISHSSWKQSHTQKNPIFFSQILNLLPMWKNEFRKAKNLMEDTE